MRFGLTVFFFALINSLFAQDLDDIIKSERESYKARYNIKSKRSGQDYNMVYQHLKLKVDPDIRFIDGSVACSIITKDTNFTQFSIDLDERMFVDSVKSGNSYLNFIHAPDELQISVDSTGIETQIDFEIFYSGDPTENEERAFNYDQHMTAAIAWSLSEPYGAYGWWPNKQDLEDKIDSFDMSINVPDWAKAAGLGILVQVDTLPDSTLTFHWQHRYPVAAYLVAVTVTNFYEEDHYIALANGDSVYHLDYLYPEYKPAADTLRRDIDGMMRLFDSLFGQYPFIKEKYGHAQFARGGGMEHQTMSSMSDLRYTLMAHELAHQWYGNKITCGSWEDLWLNEGFATYLAGIAYEFLKPRDEFIDYMTVSRDRSVSQPDGSVFATDTTNVNELFSGNMRYRKGAMVLHMLRWELGDSLFFEGMREYTASAGICYDFATTDDFKLIMEQVSGVDLTGFFDRWIYGEGHPVLATFWTRKPGNQLELDIRQQTSHPSVSFYPLNIEYRASNDVKDTTFVVEHRSAQDIFTLDLGFRVEQLTYDPNVWLAANHTLVPGDHVDITDMVIYPNPTNGDVSIFVKDKKLDRIEVLDIQGKLLYQQDVLDLKNKIVALPMSEYTNGIYFIRIEMGDEFIVSKIIKSTF